MLAQTAKKKWTLWKTASPTPLGESRTTWALFMLVLGADGLWLRLGRRLWKIKYTPHAPLTYTERKRTGCFVREIGPFAFCYRKDRG